MQPRWRLESLVDTPELAIACAGVIFVVKFRMALTAATLDALEAAHVTRRKLAPGGLAMLTLLDSGTPLPSDDMKLASARSFRRLANANACSATVVSGVGFWASAARSSLSALTLLARPACPAKVFGDLEPAITWIEAVVPGEIGRFGSLVGDIDRWKTEARIPA